MKDAYKKTEQILCAYESLNLKLVIDAKDILDLRAEGQIYSTNHKISNSDEWDAEIDDEIRHKQKIRNRERGMIRTEKLIERIDNALALLPKEDYELITDLYFDKLAVTNVAQKRGCCVRTVCRNRKRIVTELMVLFYGADALE